MLKQVDVALPSLEVGRRTRLLRKKRHETLQHVADAVGKSRGHVWQLEAGRIPNPRLDFLRPLAGHFGCTIDYLVGGTDPADDRRIPPDIANAVASLNHSELELIRSVLRRLPELKSDR